MNLKLLAPLPCSKIHPECCIESEIESEIPWLRCHAAEFVLLTHKPATESVKPTFDLPGVEAATAPIESKTQSEIESEIEPEIESEIYYVP